MGINLNETYLFYAAHGPSGFMLQQWINASAAAARPTGQILLGSFLQRSFLYDRRRVRDHACACACARLVLVVLVLCTPGVASEFLTGCFFWIRGLWTAT